KRVAVGLRERFCADLPKGAKDRPGPDAGEDSSRQLELGAIVNQPLDFELQGLDPAHPWLAGRGFTATTATHFGVGFCERGSLAGRIAIPLRDAEGKLVGYAGRATDDATATEGNPRYLF